MDRYERYALRFVNRLRRRYGAKPLDSLCVGERGNPSSCPIARSLRLDSDLVQATTRSYVACRTRGKKSERFVLPQGAMTFVLRFDDGEYPHLDKRKAGKAGKS